MSKTRFVAFATQKGGIGKSTITALVANYFHNVKGYNVAVIDCDEPQYNLADLRDEELELIKSSDYFKAQACEHFKKLGKKSFSVTRSNAVNALDDAETVLLESEVKLDFIFFDMPGTIKSEGVLKTLSQMDYIFVPISADRFVIESALGFVQLFNDNLMTPGLAVTKELAFFWTMVDKRERICMKCMKECSSPSAILYSTHGFLTASVSEENCRRIERQCSAPPSSLQTRICCEEVASRSCLTRFVKS